MEPASIPSAHMGASKLRLVTSPWQVGAGWIRWDICNMLQLMSHLRTVQKPACSSPKPMHPIPLHSSITRRSCCRCIYGLGITWELASALTWGVDPAFTTLTSMMATTVDPLGRKPSYSTWIPLRAVRSTCFCWLVSNILTSAKKEVVAPRVIEPSRNWTSMAKHKSEGRSERSHLWKVSGRDSDQYPVVPLPHWRYADQHC